MSIKLAVPEATVMHLKPRISVIGVGGGGGNAVNNMIDQNLEGVDFIVANTDAQALAHSKASRKIQLGLETTMGLGAGARPEVGRMAAEEAKEEIEKELEGANMVFITAGMGGGTGSGAAPVVARLAKAKGILTVGVVTKPFQFEGRKRMETAESAVEDFTNSVDSIIIIPNQNLFRVADKKTTLADAFIMADNVLYAGVRSITDLMMMPGLINLDFADIKSIMEDKGKAIMGTGEAKGVLINITGGSDITLFEIDEAASRIKEEVDEDANIIFGSSFDEALVGKIRVSIVATGIGEGKAAQPQPKPAAKIAQDYLKESFMPAVNTPETPSEEVDSNLEKFAATAPEAEADTVEKMIDTATIVSFDQPEEVSEIEEPAVQASVEEEKFEDFNNLETSSIINDMPQASSLFKAIINKNEDINADAQLDSILSAKENSFTAKTSLKTVEEEPELFPNHNPKPFSASRKEEPERLIVNDDDEEYTPTLIERVTGFSIAKRNRKKMAKESERFQEPVSPSFSDNDYDPEDKLNLEIPSFLRRKS